jgi:hypothetical protein
MPWPLYPRERDLIPILQEAGWTPGPVWMGVENLLPTWLRFADHPLHSESLYRPCYPGRVFRIHFNTVFPHVSLSNEFDVAVQSGVSSYSLVTRAVSNFTNMYSVHFVAGTKGSKIDIFRQTRNCIENLVTLSATLILCT